MLPNALVPTIAVIGSLLGYLIGGLVVVEWLFQTHGIGNLLYAAVRSCDFPMLEAGMLVMAAVTALDAALGDVLQPVLDPRLGQPATVRPASLRGAASRAGARSD